MKCPKCKTAMVFICEGINIHKYYECKNCGQIVSVDKLVFLPIHKERAKVISEKILNLIDLDSCFVVCIGGIAGTGKTEIATNLVEDLKGQYRVYPKLLSMDGFYSSLPFDRNKRRRETGIIGPEEINWICVNNSVSNLCNSRMYNVIVLEGLYALYYNDAHLNVYIDSTIKDTEKFRHVRAKEKKSKFREHVLKKENEAVCKTKPKAHLIFNSDNSHIWFDKPYLVR